MYRREVRRVKPADARTIHQVSERSLKCLPRSKESEVEKRRSFAFEISGRQYLPRSKFIYDLRYTYIKL